MKIKVSYLKKIAVLCVLGLGVVLILSLWVNTASRSTTPQQHISVATNAPQQIQADATDNPIRSESTERMIRVGNMVILAVASVLVLRILISAPRW